MIIEINPGDIIYNKVNSAKSGDTVIINEGIYNEKVKITASNINIIGKGNVVIQNKDYYSKLHIDNKEYNTFRTYTVMVAGDNITIDNITIKNLSIPAINYGQAVALHVIGDNFKITNSKLCSDQDTLFMSPLPTNLQTKYIGFLYPDELSPRYNHMQFINCYIEGGIDFIFGGADAIFKNCHFHSINDGYYFAPSHNKEFPYGFTIIDSKFTALYKNSMILARPWRDYGKVTIINSNIEDGIIKAEGFDKWHDTERDKTARFEYYNIGINTSTFVKWAHELNSDEANKYLEYAKSQLGN